MFKKLWCFVFCHKFYRGFLCVEVNSVTADREVIVPTLFCDTCFIIRGRAS